MRKLTLIERTRPALWRDLLHPVLLWGINGAMVWSLLHPQGWQGALVVGYALAMVRFVLVALVVHYTVKSWRLFYRWVDGGAHVNNSSTFNAINEIYHFGAKLDPRGQRAWVPLLGSGAALAYVVIVLYQGSLLAITCALLMFLAEWGVRFSRSIATSIAGLGDLVAMRG